MPSNTQNMQGSRIEPRRRIDIVHKFTSQKRWNSNLRYDNFFMAFLQNFNILTLAGWVETFGMVQDAYGQNAWVYYFTCTFSIAFFTAQIALAVISHSYQELVSELMFVSHWKKVLFEVEEEDVLKDVEKQKKLIESHIGAENRFDLLIQEDKLEVDRKEEM